MDDSMVKDIIKLCEDTQEAAFQGRILRLAIITTDDQGVVSVAARGGLVSDTIGMLQVSLNLMITCAIQGGLRS